MKRRTFFESAKNRDEYWIAYAKLAFADDLRRLMEKKKETKGGLAKKLGKTPAYITKVFRGNVNFTLESMVRLVRALGGNLRIEMEEEIVKHAVPKAKVEGFSLTSICAQAAGDFGAASGLVVSAAGQITPNVVYVTYGSGKTHRVWAAGAQGQTCKIESEISLKPNLPLPKKEAVANYDYATA